MIQGCKAMYRGPGWCIWPTTRGLLPAAFFGNFTWNSGKHTGVSQGKIIVFRTLTPHKENEYNRIKQR